MLVLKKNVHRHFQYISHNERKSFSCPRTQKRFTSYYMHFSSLKYVINFFIVSAMLHHISLLRLLPKSYFKICTFQPIFCALAPLKSDLCFIYDSIFVMSIFCLSYRYDIWSFYCNVKIKYVKHSTHKKVILAH